MTDKEILELFEELAKPQIANSYKKNRDAYKKLAMDQEDVEQEMLILFFNIVRNTKLEGEELLKFLVSSVKNRLLNIVIHAGTKPSLDSIPEDNDYLSVQNKDDEVYLSESIPLKFRDIKKYLSETDYFILHSVFVKKWSFVRISDELGMKESTIKMRYSRALQKLKKEMKNFCDDL